MPGDVVELVDTLGLEPSAARRGGSTPSIPTNLILKIDTLFIKMLVKLFFIYILKRVC